MRTEQQIERSALVRIHETEEQNGVFTDLRRNRECGFSCDSNITRSLGGDGDAVAHTSDVEDDDGLGLHLKQGSSERTDHAPAPDRAIAALSTEVPRCVMASANASATSAGFKGWSSPRRWPTIACTCSFVAAP